MLNHDQRGRPADVPTLPRRGSLPDLRRISGWLNGQVAASSALLLLLGSTVEARTWVVQQDGTGDFDSIQQAIGQSIHGDDVLVGPGTYDESIDFLGRRIVVHSEFGPDATTIDGSGRSQSVVTFVTGETRESILRGFTITGGNGTPLFGPSTSCGGGILIVNCSPIIEGNRITDNSARVVAPTGPKGYGGGVYCAPGPVTPSALIKGNLVGGNVAGLDGGGIAIDGNGAVEILQNTISDNRVDRGDGGGIWILSNRGGAIVSGNAIVGNTTADHGGGFYESSAVGVPFVSVVSGNFFYGNRAGGVALTGTSGGGLWLGRSGCLVSNNTFIANSGGGSGAQGGNVAIEKDGSARFERNIIAMATEGGGVGCASATSTFVENIVWSNSDGDGRGLCTTWFATGGNLVVDPLLCHPDMADPSVAENSPALTSPVGVIGSSAVPGCPGVQIVPVTWSRIKALFK